MNHEGGWYPFQTIQGYQINGLTVDIEGALRRLQKNVDALIAILNKPDFLYQSPDMSTLSSFWMLTHHITTYTLTNAF